MTQTMKGIIEGYNKEGHGITWAKAEELKSKELVQITVYEPWKPMSGMVVSNFRTEEQAQDFLNERMNLNKGFVTSH